MSVRGSRSESPSVYTVLIKTDDGSTSEQHWAAAAVDGLALPVDNLALAPRDVSERPRTKKARYTLTYSVQPAIKIDPLEEENEAPPTDAAEAPEEAPKPEPEWRTYGTTSPQALAIALIAWLVGLGLRNMLTSGSPFDLQPRERHRIQEQRTSGSTGRPSQQSPSKKTAPNRQTSRKNRRRRG